MKEATLVAREQRRMANPFSWAKAVGFINRALKHTPTLVQKLVYVKNVDDLKSAVYLLTTFIAIILFGSLMESI